MGSQHKLSTYQCHKKVQAGKIVSVESSPSSVKMLVESGRQERPVEFIMGISWMAKHDPRKGGYLVIYEDNYISYSPAGAFENGYTLAGAVTPEEA